MNRIKFYKYFLCLIALCVVVHAQQEYLIRDYNISDGLIQSTVNAIYRDNAGFLWIGTDRGLSRYDGKNFENFSQPEILFDKPIIKILQDETGTLLLLSESGRIWQFDGFTFAIYPLFDETSDVFVTSMAKLDSCLVIGTSEHGVYIKDPTMLQQFTIDQGLYSNCIIRFNKDRMNNLHIVTSEGVNSFIDGEVRALFKNDALKFSNLIQHSKGNYWCTVDGEGVYRLENGKWERKLHTLISPFNELVEDSTTTIWAAFELLLFRIVDNSFGEVYTFTELEMGVSCVTIDESDNAWVGTYGNGFKRITKNLFVNFVPLRNFPGFFARILFQDVNHNIWISAAQQGLVRFGEQYNFYTSENGLLDNNVHDVCEYENQVLVASDHGIAAFNNGKFSRFTKPNKPIEGRPARMFVDSQGVLWVATRTRGFYRLINNEWLKLELDFESGIESVRVIFEDSNNTLWFATYIDGVYIYTRDKLIHMDKNNGLTSNSIITIAEDSEKKVWIGTLKGINIFDNYSLSDTLSTKDGLFSDVIYALACYKDKMLVGTPDGFGIYSEAKFKFFTTVDGLPSNDISSHKMEIDDYGKAFFGTNYGFSIFQIESYLAKNKNYDIIISEVICGEDTTSFNYLQPSSISGALVFPSNSDQVKFSYSPIEYSAIPLTYRYLVTLNEISGEWFLTNEPSVVNLDCSPGSYRFILQAKAFGDEWQTVDEKQYVIEYPFYRTSTFYSFGFIFILISGIVYFYLRARKARRLLENKYKTSSLSKERSLILKVDLEKLIEKEKLYRDPDLSLQILSDKMEASKEHISQVINSEFQKSFNDYVNGKRVQEATEYLKINGKVGLQIIQIAYEVGFNNKSSFNNAFKKFIGITPTEYRKTYSNKPNS